MLLTITTSHRPATDLGHLLHKHPDRHQFEEFWFGRVHVFYPEASPDRCTAAILLEVDPIGLVRNRRRHHDAALEQYVNDRPYVASSFLSVALARMFQTALGGRCKARPELAAEPIGLTARLSVIKCRGGGDLVRTLFEPLGYTVETRHHPLDERFVEWGAGAYHTVTLSGHQRLADLLRHLYVLVPVLDDDKHYFVGDDEVDKLLGKGAGWLDQHPARNLITRRYLKHQRGLARQAIDRLVREEGPDPDRQDERAAAEEQEVERPLSLDEQRLGSVLAALQAAGARSVVDLGCGEGKLLRRLLAVPSFERIVGLDVSNRALARAADRLRLEHMPPRKRARIELLQGALTYRDQRLAGFDAAAVVEVIEHLDAHRLDSFARVLFEHTRPAVVVLTTPNREYNARFDNLAAGELRHRDHRFEWTRAEFASWCRAQADRFGYRVRQLPVGQVDPDLGPPTQMAVFNLGSAAEEPA